MTNLLLSITHLIAEILSRSRSITCEADLHRLAAELTPQFLRRFYALAVEAIPNPSTLRGIPTQSWLPLVGKHYWAAEGVSSPDLRALQHWVNDQFRKIPYRVEYVDDNPYPSLSVMHSEVRAGGVLKISTLNNTSIFDPVINLMFRAIHDADHLAGMCNFQANGERLACRAMMQRCGDAEGQRVIFSEILGQACATVFFGRFLPQKYVIYDQRTIDVALSTDLVDPEGGDHV